MKRKFIAHSHTHVTVTGRDGVSREYSARGSDGRVYDITHMSAVDSGSQVFQSPPRGRVWDPRTSIALDCDGEALIDVLRRFYRSEPPDL